MQARKSSEERKQEIVRAVLHLISTEGVKSLTAASIAKQIGVSSGALFKHFADMDSMLIEAATYACSEIDKTFPEGERSAEERLLLLATNRVKLIHSEPGIAWLLRSEEVYKVLPKEGIEILSKMVQKSRSFLMSAIEDGMRDGSLRDDCKPESLLMVVTGTIQNLISKAGFSGRAVSAVEARMNRVLNDLIRMLSAQ